jgi:hypothetical protein
MLMTGGSLKMDIKPMDAAEVAAGLSRPQRLALLSCPVDRMGAGLLVALYQRGLVNLNAMGDVITTPLGRSVIEHLDAMA